MITKQHDGGGCGSGHCSIPDKFEDRPNNHGTMAGAAWAASAVYLGRQSDLDHIAKVFKGYLGDRSSYADFNYGTLDWQSDPSKPVGINPKGATLQGHNVDGVLPDDQRRWSSNGDFTWPPPKEPYVYEGLQGAIVLATILKNQGYNAPSWNDKALLRAYQWLKKEANYPAEGDDTFQLPLVDYHYSAGFWNGSKTRHGKNMGWTGWTHGSASSGGSAGSGGGGGSSTSGSPEETLGPPENVRVIVDDQ